MLAVLQAFCAIPQTFRATSQFSYGIYCSRWTNHAFFSTANTNFWIVICRNFLLKKSALNLYEYVKLHFGKAIFLRVLYFLHFIRAFHKILCIFYNKSAQRHFRFTELFAFIIVMAIIIVNFNYRTFMGFMIFVHFIKMLCMKISIFASLLLVSFSGNSFLRP